MEDREGDFILFDSDSVLTKVDGLGDLGIAQNPNLMNVTHTRARRGMLLLFHEAITSGALVENWKDKKDTTGRGDPEVSL